MTANDGPPSPPHSASLTAPPRRRALKLVVIATCAIAAPIGVLTALALLVNRPVYGVKSSSWSDDHRFRVDNESASTFDVSYRRVRLVRGDNEADSRVFCESAGGDLVGYWVGDHSFVVTIPEFAGRPPSPDVFSVRFDFDPADLGTTEVTQLGGSGGC